MLQAGLFYLISLAVLVFAIGVITCRSAIYSVLCLVAAMGMMAGLFTLLKAYLVATILILVYAGAILVLFLFVVMLLDFKTLSFDWGGFGLSPALAILGGGLFFWEAFRVIQAVRLPAGVAPVEGTTRAIGETLFNHYVLPFELTSFLLLAAVVSVVVLAKRQVK